MAGERTAEELEQLLENALAENQELQGKLDVAEAANKNLRERLDLAQKGLKLANIDALPKSVADDARRRIAMGLPEAQAIQKALDQYSHDQAQEKKGKRATDGHADGTPEHFIDELLVEGADVHAIKEELKRQTLQLLRNVVDGLAKQSIKVEVKDGEKNKDNIASAIVEAVAKK